VAALQPYGSEAIRWRYPDFHPAGGEQQGAQGPGASATAGSRNYHCGHAGVSGGLGNAWYNLGLTSMGTRGIDARPDALRRSTDNGRLPRRVANINAGYRFDNGLETGRACHPEVRLAQ